MLVTWQTNCGNSRLFLFDFKVCALPYCSDIRREGFFVSIFYKIIVYVYVLLTHKSVEAANFKPLSKMCKQNTLLCVILYISISIQTAGLCPYVWFCA